jgi:hypothetical protein
MKLIGITSSKRKIYYLPIAKWIEVSGRENIVLTEQDIFEAYCLMNHLANLELCGILREFEMARNYGIGHKRWLISKSTWARMKVVNNAKNRSKIREIGQSIAIDEFKT